MFVVCRPHKSHHTSFMSIFFPVFYYLGRRNSSRIFQIQLCVFGKGNQVLLKIMICRLWYSYSGLTGNKMWVFFSQCYKDLGQKNNALKYCDSALSILSVTNEVSTESDNLFSYDCCLIFGAHYCTVSNNITFQFFF